LQRFTPFPSNRSVAQPRKRCSIGTQSLRVSRAQFARGLASFYLVCAVDALAHVGAANVWWVAGLAGAAIGAVWNYAALQLVTWRQDR